MNVTTSRARPTHLSFWCLVLIAATSDSWVLKCFDRDNKGCFNWRNIIFSERIYVENWGTIKDFECQNLTPIIKLSQRHFYDCFSIHCDVRVPLPLAAVIQEGSRFKISYIFIVKILFLYMILRPVRLFTYFVRTECNELSKIIQKVFRAYVM